MSKTSKTEQELSKEIYDLMYMDSNAIKKLFSGIAELANAFAFNGFDYKEKYADISKILVERKKKGEKGDLSLMIRYSIERGNNISRWVQKIPEPQKKVVLELKKVYGLVDAKTDRDCLTLSRVALLFPVETCALMRKCKNVLSLKNIKIFVPHIDAAVMHPAFNLLVPKAFESILELTMVLNALWTQKVGKAETKEKPLHELLDEVKVFVEKKFANEYCDEAKRKRSMVGLGFFKMEKVETTEGEPPKTIYTPNRDFIAMILEGSRLYETIKKEEWKTLWNSSSKYKRFRPEELEEKISVFIHGFAEDQ